MIGDSYSIPLNQAYLCASCDRIGGDASKCHWCDSPHSLIALSGILNRKDNVCAEPLRKGLHEAIAKLESAFEFKTSSVGMSEESRA